MHDRQHRGLAALAERSARVLGVERASLRRTLGVEAAAAALFALVPTSLFLGPLGPFRAPGLEGEGLYGQLFAGAMVRRWLTGASAPGVADIAGGAPWWPASPLGAGLQAALPIDPAWALGLVVVFGVWLSGYGPWRLARRVLPSAPLWGALCAGLVAQTSPVVLRALPDVNLAALAVGAVALGLAHPRLAWIGGLWSVPGAVVFGVAGLVGRRLPWLLAALPALALLLPASALPGALRTVAPPVPSSPAYVSTSGASFPLPPAEQVAVLAAAQRTRTGLWLPAEVTPTVQGTLFGHAPGTPGSGPPGPPGEGPPGAGGDSSSWGGAPPRNAPPGGQAPLDPQRDPQDPQMDSQPGMAPGAEGMAPGGVPSEPVAAPVPGLIPPEGGAGMAPQEGGPGGPGAMAEGPKGPTLKDGFWLGALLIPLQRVHGGAAAALGLLAALLLGRGRPASGEAPASSEAPVAVRIAAAGGLLGLVALTLAFGWQAAPGETERDPLLAEGLRVLLSGAQIAALPGGGALAWGALVPALGGLGIAAFTRVARVPVALRVAACVALVGLGVGLENPRLIAPVASVPPDPVRDTLKSLPGDQLLVFPSPVWPYLQGQRPAASMFWEAAATGQQVEARGTDAGAAALIGALTALTAVPVDIEAARTLWSAHQADALGAARAAGWRYLLVDLEAIAPTSRHRIDGWLAERAGIPMARDRSRLLYDLSTGPGAALPVPGGVPGGPGGVPGAVPGGPGGAPGW